MCWARGVNIFCLLHGLLQFATSKLGTRDTMTASLKLLYTLQSLHSRYRR